MILILSTGFLKHTQSLQILKLLIEFITLCSNDRSFHKNFLFIVCLLLKFVSSDYLEKEYVLIFSRGKVNLLMFNDIMIETFQIISM